MIVAGIVIAHSWFGLFSSPEYYKGFDWNTDKKKLEWRLSKDHYWYDDTEYKTSARKLEENSNIRFYDSFFLDEKTQKLKEIRLVYLVEDNVKLEQVYANEVDELKRRLGRGTEGEAGDALFTEWRGKHSIIRVSKQDCEYEDLNTYVEVVYQDKGEYNEPYFTETHLWQDVYEKMIDSFYCVSTPEYDADTIRASKNNDYSAYKLRPTDETKKVIALMNKYLFSGEDKGTQVARRIASSKGITVENPLSVDWVMKHPAKTLLILRHLTKEKDFFKSKSEIDKAYNLLTKEEQQRA
jgi:hypothetical protein